MVYQQHKNTDASRQTENTTAIINIIKEVLLGIIKWKKKYSMLIFLLLHLLLFLYHRVVFSPFALHFIRYTINESFFFNLKYWRNVNCKRKWLFEINFKHFHEMFYIFWQYQFEKRNFGYLTDHECQLLA